MSNPLKSMMGRPVNELLGQMANADPQQMLMNMLKQQNPQGYDMLQQMMKSGQDPQQILNQMTSKMDPQQIQYIRQMASQFGIR